MSITQDKGDDYSLADIASKRLNRFQYAKPIYIKNCTKKNKKSNKNIYHEIQRSSPNMPHSNSYITFPILSVAYTILCYQISENQQQKIAKLRGKDYLI